MCPDLRHAVLVTLLWLAAAISPAAAQSSADGTLRISEVWASRAPGGPHLGVFMTLSSSIDGDALVAARSTAAAKAVVYDHILSDGASRMVETTIPLPAGQSVVLAPRRLIVRLEGLHAEPAVGETVEVELRFRKTGSIVVKALIKRWPL
jgi:periplasmic copper chaperone A